GSSEVSFVLLAVGVVLLGLWFLVSKYASRSMQQRLRPIFAGTSAGMFLGIVYMMIGQGTALALAVPVGIIAYFNLTDRRRQREAHRSEPEPERRRRRRG